MINTITQRRQVIPRWLSYRASSLLDAHNLISSNYNTTRNNGEHVLDDWKKMPTLDTAAELVVESMVLKLPPNGAAYDAAWFIKNKAPQSALLLHELASVFLEDIPQNDFGQLTQVDNSRSEQIRGLKRTLNSSPLNPIAWSDLSLHYAIQGLPNQASKAMTTALALAPTNRFVLRNASRCFLHLNEEERAHDILKKSKLIGIDPWITSAEIALADTLNLHNIQVKRALSLLENKNFSDHSKSELAIALFTIESKDEPMRKIRKFLNQSLSAPTENSLAQVAWLLRNKKISAIEFSPNLLKQVVPLEAEALRLQNYQQYDLALNAIKNWEVFQPFCPQPCIMGTYVASVFLDDNQKALDFFTKTSEVNRHNSMLLNNVAFSCAKLGKVSEAREYVREARKRMDCNDSEYMKLAVTATDGLICFRVNDIDKGRQLYQEAVSGFDKMKNSKGIIGATMASFFWALEEKRIKSETSQKILDKAKERNKKVPSPDFEILLKKYVP